MYQHPKRLAALALFFSLLPARAHALPATPQELLQTLSPRPEVRVLLGSFRRVMLSGVDLLVNGNTTLAGESVFSVSCGFEAGRPFIDFGAGKKQVDRLEVSSPGGFLQVNGKVYRNRLTLLAKNGECAVVNTVDLEKYLAGLINREMAPGWPEAAMKAQAVASRSYALYQAHINRHREYDVEGTTQDQVYEGASSETPKSNRAAEETRGEVLTFDGDTIKAYFHANCGGHTELPGAVWGAKSGAFRRVSCPYHRRPRDKLSWSTVLTKLQLENVLKKVSGIMPSGLVRVAKFEAGALSSPERLSQVVVSDATGKRLTIPANAFRNAVGNTLVKSTAFRIHQEGASYRLSGQGFGHGVGMCQIGARAMAEEGKTYRQILAHYYPLGKIKRL